VEAGEPGDTGTAKSLSPIAFIWIYVVIGIPYIILGLVGGFGTSFRSGDASTFMCGAIIAAVGENLIGQAENGFPRFRKPKPGTCPGSRARGIVSLHVAYFVILTLGTLAWNLYFAVQDKTVHYPPLDWVQILAFYSAATSLVTLRFILSDYYDNIIAFLRE
jgi:hypothetical protein